MQNDSLRQADAALAASRDLYVDLYEFALVGYLTLSAGGMVVGVNLTGVALLGRERATLLRERFASLVSAEDQMRWTQHFLNVKQHLGGRGVELSLTRGDGTMFQAQLDCVRVEGSAIEIRVTLSDITVRKEAEAARVSLENQLRESQKMEALGTLAGGIAHDFNNVSTTIAGNVALARHGVGPGHAALESLEEIDKASRRATALVQQILTFGRRQTTERRVISLAPTVKESARLLRTALPAAISLTVECAADAPAVLAEAGQIQQVVLNLCNNAWHAIRGQALPGRIAIRLAAFERKPNGTSGSEPANEPLGPLSVGRYACLSVRDNGAGMGPEIQEHLFEPFFTTKPVGEGTGLGLSVVHGIVRGHGGVIQVHSQPGEGTVFRIYFPEAGSPADLFFAPGQESARAREATAPAVQGDGVHVLCVDDDQALLTLTKRLLEREGYRVTGYADPNEALAAVHAEPGLFDLAVTDYSMPSMTGLALSGALREIRADLPVVLVSGHMTDDVRLEAPGAGVSALLSKPYTAKELCKVVSHQVHAQRRRQKAD